MNILYLSHLSGASYAGPTYSVPKQIEAQSKIDNVFWYNACKTNNLEWKKYSYYHDIYEYPNETIKDLPEPFNNPDIIVVELFYNMTKSPMLRELIRTNTPYVIIPRGELTSQGQVRKTIKKKIANWLICKKYAKKAAAIQYLTNQEYEDSGDLWNETHIIIPNGIDLPDRVKTPCSDDSIKCIFIGRIEPYQKGLDLLVDACMEIKEQLIKAGCIITICGPDKENKLLSLQNKVHSFGLDTIVVFHDGVFGKEKEEMLLDNDVFLMTSRFEGHPMALIEALSYGLPAVVTTGSNMRKEIEKYNAGWGADSSVDSIKKALLSVIKEKDQIEIKRDASLLLASKYDWKMIANCSHQKYVDILREYRGASL